MPEGILCKKNIHSLFPSLLWLTLQSIPELPANEDCHAQIIFFSYCGLVSPCRKKDDWCHFLITYFHLQEPKEKSYSLLSMKTPKGKFLVGVAGITCSSLDQSLKLEEWMSHFDRPDTYLVPTPGLGRRYYDRQSKPEGRGKPDRQKTENIYKHLLYMAYTSFDNLNTVYIYSLISFLSLNHITLQK